jgi:predicted acyl esterase
VEAFLSREAWDDYYAERTPDLSKVTIPMMTAANWGGQGLHTRGNFEGFVRSSSSQKWLEVHGGSHWAPFYTDYGLDLQKRFFAFLKNEKNGWDKQPRVLLNVRHPGEKFVQRHENEWALRRTKWTKFFCTRISPSMRVKRAGRAPSRMTRRGMALRSPCKQKKKWRSPAHRR